MLVFVFLLPITICLYHIIRAIRIRYWWWLGLEAIEGEVIIRPFVKDGDNVTRAAIARENALAEINERTPEYRNIVRQYELVVRGISPNSALFTKNVEIRYFNHEPQWGTREEVIYFLPNDVEEKPYTLEQIKRMKSFRFMDLFGIVVTLPFLIMSVAMLLETVGL